MAASDSSMSIPVQICSGVMAVEISWFQSWHTTDSESPKTLLWRLRLPWLDILQRLDVDLQALEIHTQLSVRPMGRLEDVLGALHRRPPEGALLVRVQRP